MRPFNLAYIPMAVSYWFSSGNLDVYIVWYLTESNVFLSEQFFMFYETFLTTKSNDWSVRWKIGWSTYLLYILFISAIQYYDKQPSISRSISPNLTLIKLWTGGTAALLIHRAALPVLMYQPYSTGYNKRAQSRVSWRWKIFESWFSWKNITVKFL